MRNRKRVFIAVFAGTTVFATAFAMAVSLGGITSQPVGADDSAVASCDTNGVTTNYVTSWSTVPTPDTYVVSSVTVGAVDDACDGQNLSVSITDSGGVQIGSGTIAIPVSAAVSFAVALVAPVSARDTEGVHVLITS